MKTGQMALLEKDNKEQIRQKSLPHLVELFFYFITFHKETLSETKKKTSK
jgi:hypothetical protein